MIRRFLTALGLVAAVAFSIARTTRPPRPVAATAPDTVFSAERAVRHISSLGRQPHPMGTVEHDRVRDYLVAQLAMLAIPSETQNTTGIGTRYQEAGRVQNVIGVLGGSGSSRQAVLLVAHYDGVEASPAAADDGAGVAAVLEVLRAIRARKTPLRHDVIALFTDGEESGITGAAAFVREHPRAKDVAFVINLEARGTRGRSLMFETGSGNLDAVRTLRAAGDVTAGSVFAAVYRVLPNDTDLSELFALGVPALNFAFTDGVERYHTSRDDSMHLDAGSVQHHGAQALAVATKVASEALPRPATGDAVFFDLPAVGLVVYPTWLAIPLFVVALVLFVAAVWPVSRRGWTGPALMLVAVVGTAIIASRVRLSGHAMWSGWWAAAVACFAIGLNAALYRFVDRRWGSARFGALVVWLVLAAVSTFAAPAVSYLFTWPTLFASIAMRSRHAVAEWLSACFALVLLAGPASAAAAVLLGVSGIGAMALATFAALLTWLVGALLSEVFGSWRVVLVAMVALAVVAALVGRATDGPTTDHPVRSSLVYAENVNSGEAFFGTTRPSETWARSVLRSTATGPAWTAALGPYRQLLHGHALPRVGLDEPTVVIVGDSTIGSARALTFLVKAPGGTTAVVMRATGAGLHVLSAAVDGHAVDPTRYRVRLPNWGLEYWNVPPEGASIRIVVPANVQGAFEIAARRPGLPSSLPVAARPDYVVASQSGDVSIVYKAIGF